MTKKLTDKILAMGDISVFCTLVSFCGLLLGFLAVAISRSIQIPNNANDEQKGQTVQDVQVVKNREAFFEN